MFQLEMFWLKFVAPSNMDAKLSARLISQESRGLIKCYCSGKSAVQVLGAGQFPLRQVLIERRCSLKQFEHPNCILYIPRSNRRIESLRVPEHFVREEDISRIPQV